MNFNKPLLALTRSLSKKPTERRIIAKSLSLLINSRKEILKFLIPFSYIDFNYNKPKLSFWFLLIKLASRQKIAILNEERFLVYLRSTSAYIEASSMIHSDINSCFSRGDNYSDVLFRLQEDPPERLFVFHHYDKTGFLPDSWLNTILSIKDSGWIIILSTSNLRVESVNRLESLGIIVAKRLNIGRCLGAYKDLSLLIQNNNKVCSRLKSLILCNDSMLPISSEESVVNHIDHLVSTYENYKHPLMAGLTDSSERGLYHLQSYFLYTNCLCFNSEFWTNFWLRFNPSLDKEQLIDNGEIALSQIALSNDIELKCMYPLIDALLNEQSISLELKEVGIDKITDVNQTLFAWKSLLDRGFPFIKKQVIFGIENSKIDPLLKSNMLSLMPIANKKIFLNDVSQIFIARNLSDGLGKHL
tara:strand:- start:530 stop:1777 length:1248 start_codon:yes stop_codon:yes gene_type:complete